MAVIPKQLTAMFLQTEQGGESFVQKLQSVNL
jgi:hypothetical protein